ncbi:MAG: transposase [Clostridium sp.]|nr:transposase [Clostridium sp.]
MDAVKSISGNSKPLRTIINKLYRNNVNGFYVHAKSEIKSAKMAAKYVGRYVGRPAIAESRILQYDGIYVTYKYTRHEDDKVVIEKVHVYEFIKKLIIYIPEKHFNMVRYFGIYSTRSKGNYNILKMIEDRILKLRKSLDKWQYRILASFGVNPCDCPICNKRMKFYDIVYPKYGSMREYLKTKIIEGVREKLEEALEIYAITRGIIYGRINPTTR